MKPTPLSPVPAADAALRQDIINYLSGPEFPTLQGVTIDVVDGTVTLRGRVGSYYTKQVLVHACRCMKRVTEVIDRLHVAGWESR